MESNYFFYKLSQGNQTENSIGGTKPSIEDIRVLKLKYDNKVKLADEIFWLYYTKLVYEPVKESDFKDNSHLTWLKCNLSQKALIAINVMIGQANNGGTFSLFINFPEYYFAAFEAIRFFELSDLEKRYGVVLSYVQKNFGTIDQLEKTWLNDPNDFHKKKEAFLDVHDERIISFDETDHLMWDDEFKKTMYAKIIAKLEQTSF